jgi:AAA domain/UvrD-like helicase C-terminal domain
MYDTNTDAANFAAFFSDDESPAQPVVPVAGPGLSQEQLGAVDQLLELVDSGQPLCALIGPAGTGKTTTMRTLAERLKYPTLAAPTNRAARVLGAKTGRETLTIYKACMRPTFLEPFATLSEFYHEPSRRVLQSEAKADVLRPSRRSYGDGMPACVLEKWPGDWHTKAETLSEAVALLKIDVMGDWFDQWELREEQAGTIIIDEASMVSLDDLDLVMKVFKSVVLVGDVRQLPPVWDKGGPDPRVLHRLRPELCVELKEIHRQGAGSEILDIAEQAHLYGGIPAPVEKLTVQQIRDGVPLIVHRNATRLRRTREIRDALGLPADRVVVGEPLICRMNSPERGICNNEMFIVAAEAPGGKFVLQAAHDPSLTVTTNVAMEELDQYRGIPFRFGYAITCHTAQGGEWPIVAIDNMDVLQLFGSDRNAWCYTAVTRASERVFLAKEGVHDE